MTEALENAAMESAPSPSADANERVLILEPGRAERNYWSDLWTYRELFLILAWRDVAVQYKQTVFGVAWAVIRPLLTMAIFTFVFGRVARLPSVGDAPYPVMVFAGMVAWFLFATILNQAANSLTANVNLIGKVYFPRLIIPGASSVTALVDFAISLMLMIGMAAYFRFLPDWRIVFLPIFVLLTVLAAIGPALVLAALNVRYRDFKIIVPFIVQFGLYVSPVGFSSAVIPEKWRLLYGLNPMTGVIDGFRWCLLRGQPEPYMPGLYLGLAVILLFLWLGVRTFRATEKTFADMI